MTNEQANGSLERSFGRQAFGADPANYHAARPPYPEAVWQALRERAGLRRGIDILEIGAGTGLATVPLLAHRPARLVAVEPDARLAEFLRTTAADPVLQVMTAPFETAKLPPAAFDLAVSATAFHWLEAVPALRRVHALLRPDGAVALVWNSFDHSRPDPFHEATVHLFSGQRTSASASEAGRPPHALDAEQRIEDFSAAGFTTDAPQFLDWEIHVDAAGIRRLYASFSNVAALPTPERSRLLDALAEVALREFGDRVARYVTTAIYTATRL